MKQKTFKLYKDCGKTPFPVKEGEKYVLIERCKEEQDAGYFDLRKDTGGIGGNLNPEIKKYHGWRGTSYGTALYAHGLRKVISASEPMEDKDGGIYQKITVGEDLLPDED